MTHTAKEKIIVALDPPDLRSALRLIDELDRLIIGLVKRIHVRDDLIDPETLRIRSELFHSIGRMASPDWYCRTRDRFEMIRPP